MTTPSEPLVLRTIAPVVQIAGRGARLARRLGTVSGGSAAVLTTVVGGALWPIGAPGLVVLGAVTLLALVPAGVLLGFAYGLERLARTPAELVETARSVAVRDPVVPAEGAGAVRTVWRLASYLFRARDIVGEVMGRAAEAGLLVRLANPWTLLAVLASVGLTVLLLAAAAVAVLFVLIGA